LHNYDLFEILVSLSEIKYFQLKYYVIKLSKVKKYVNDVYKY